jgi:hypothetical protein
MSQIVEEGDLDFRHFRCCGDEDLYPFGCPRCGRLMVFCYECDTLHGDLNDLARPGSWAVNNFDTSAPIFSCPQCAYPFEYFFMRDGRYKTSFDQWRRQGVSHLLRSDRQPSNAEGHRGLSVEIGGVPVDLNAGMIQTVTNPPHGFVSKLSFGQTNLAARLRAIPWFAHSGQAFDLDLTMTKERVTDWPTAIASCKDPVWENVELEAQNQLTLWLHLHDHSHYQKWNDIVLAHKASVVNPLIEQAVIPFQEKHGLDIAFVHSVQWDILGALMENSYLGSGHKAFFFLELLMVYEAGHFPCGWVGEWPQGKLLVY